MLDKIIKDWGGTEVSPIEVYTDIFDLGYGSIQKENEEPGLFKANPIGYWKNKNESKGHYRILFEDTFEEVLKELQEADFSILNGLSYFGRKNSQEHASKMYAMIFDLDGVTEDTLSNFFSGAFRSEAYPIPNYVILSGHGVHLYYVFEYAIPLYPNIKLQLKELKYALVKKMWNRYTSIQEKVQYQGINQGFRVIGGKTKIDNVKVRAFSLNTTPFNLENLGSFVPNEFRVDESKLFTESKMTLSEAKKKWPEWYEKRVIQGNPKGTWTVKRDLYDWWIRNIYESAEVGHRYFCIMCLAIYGVKCGIEYDEVKKDALDLVPYLNGLNTKEAFTKEDCMSALECYDERYITFPRDDISKLSGIEIRPNKRNYRKQNQHMEVMRAIQNITNPNWRDGNGRKPKKDIVSEWRSEHPAGKKIDCHKDTGLSRVTIDKWWDS